MSSPPDTDPTRKERREQARAQRRALEEEAATQAARRRRLIQLGSVLGAVVVIVAVILVATGGTGGGHSGLSTKPSEVNENVTAVKKLIGGIPQSGNTLGNPKAPVTLQYFGDLECPICKEFTLGALPGVIEKYVKPGKVKIEYHSMETATHEQETFRSQQIAASAAGKQKLAWDYIELFYREQGAENSGYVTEKYLQGLAEQVPGLDLPNWSAARNNPELAEEITHDAQTVNQQGFTGTPAFLLGKSGGPLAKLVNPNLEQPSDFESAIDKLLA